MTIVRFLRYNVEISKLSEVLVSYFSFCLSFYILVKSKFQKKYKLTFDSFYVLKFLSPISFYKKFLLQC